MSLKVRGHDVTVGGMTNADVMDLLSNPWLDTAEAAAYAGRSADHIRREAAKGTLRSTSPGRGRGRRYRKSWVDEWMDQPERAGRRSS